MLRTRWRRGEVDAEEIGMRVRGWIAHAAHADTVRLRHTLFKGGWFDPWWADGTPVKVPVP